MASGDKRKGYLPAYEFLLNDSPLVDDHFLTDKSWFPFPELDECGQSRRLRDQIVVMPFVLPADTVASSSLKRKRSQLNSHLEEVVSHVESI